MRTPRQSCSWGQHDRQYPHQISLHLSIAYHTKSCRLMWWCTMQNMAMSSQVTAVKHSSVQCRVWSAVVVEVERMVELERSWAGSRKEGKSYMWPWSRFKIHYVSLAMREVAKEQRGREPERMDEWNENKLEFIGLCENSKKRRKKSSEGKRKEAIILKWSNISAEQPSFDPI